MKTIGLLGGMSWESTVTYYRLINESIRKELGGFHSAKIVLYSVDFYEVEELQRLGEWREAGLLLAEAAARVESAGADLLLLCTNTMHEVSAEIERRIKIPFLHIADATAEEIQREGMATVGLLGTRFTMERVFYRGRLESKHGLKVLVPEGQDREFVHRVIYEDLCLGKLRNESRLQFREIIRKLADQGARGIILGCTEISLLVKAEDSPVPLFDTTAIHARKAVQWAIQGMGSRKESHPEKAQDK
jgi:aspartate racemase